MRGKPVRREHFGLLLLLALVAGLCLHFVVAFPNGWDPTEYAWCVRDGRLPHGPYIAYLVAGQLFGLLFAAPLALSLLSLVAGLGALVLLYAGRLREGCPRSVAFAAVAVLGTLHVFVRQSATQEVYALQTALLLASAWALAGVGRFAATRSALLFGTAVATHSASLFVLPALLLRTGGRGWRDATLWLGVAAGAVLVWVGWVWLRFPFSGESDRVDELLLYLRGFPPPLAATDVGSAYGSLAGLLGRLTDAAVPMGHGAAATGPTGLSWLLLVGAGAGAVFGLRVRRSASAFWILYPLPYLAYEVAVGSGVDWGTYLPFVAPPIAVFASELVGGVGRVLRERAGERGGWAAPLATALLVLPALPVIGAHWEDPEADLARHYRPHTLAAIWMQQNLPRDAVVVAPRADPNPNLLPYYARRTHVFHRGAVPVLFVDRGAYTPLSSRSYVPLTTARILELVGQGRPFFAFEPEPFSRVPHRFVDAARFAWMPAREIALAPLAAARSLPESARTRDAVLLYRMELRRGPVAR